MNQKDIKRIHARLDNILNESQPIPANGCMEEKRVTTKTEAFAQFGATLKDVHAWAAASDDKEKVIIAAWSHDFTRLNGKGEFYIALSNSDPAAPEAHRLRKRTQLLTHAREALGGLLHVVVAYAKEGARETRDNIARPDLLLRLRCLDIVTGSFVAEVVRGSFVSEEGK